MGNTSSTSSSFGKCGTCSQGATYFFGASKSAHKKVTKVTSQKKRYYKGYIVHKNNKGRYILKKKKKVYLKSGTRTYSTKDASLYKKSTTRPKTKQYKKNRFG
jgi:hypothetical protein